MKKELMPIPKQPSENFENETKEEHKSRIKEGVEWMEYLKNNFPGEEWTIYCIVFFNTFTIGELSVEISYSQMREMLLANWGDLIEDELIPDNSQGYIFRPADDVIKESLERMIKKDLIKVDNNVYSINIFHELNILFEDKAIVHSRFLV